MFIEEELLIDMFLLPLSKIVDIDTNEEYKIDAECKFIYAQLQGWGKTQGWNNIYPNQDLMCQELGITASTLKRKLKVLGNSGLIDIIPTKDVSKFTSNRYRVNQPKTIRRRKYYTITGEQLTGKLYKFDSNIFNKD